MTEIGYSDHGENLRDVTAVDGTGSIECEVERRPSAAQHAPEAKPLDLRRSSFCAQREPVRGALIAPKVIRPARHGLVQSSSESRTALWWREWCQGARNALLAVPVIVPPPALRAPLINSYCGSRGDLSPEVENPKRCNPPPTRGRGREWGPGRPHTPSPPLWGRAGVGGGLSQ